MFTPLLPACIVPLLLKLLIVDLLSDFPQTVIANLEVSLLIILSLLKVSMMAPPLLLLVPILILMLVALLSPIMVPWFKKSRS